MPGRLPAQAGLMVLSTIVALKMWFVYIIKSLNKKWYYVGSTNYLKRRLNEHNTGKSISTKAYKPFILVYKKEFTTQYEAIIFEKN